MSQNNFPSIKVGNNGPVDPSAAVDIVSTTQGLLPPRMTTTQRLAIASPQNGLIVYDTTLNQQYTYANNTWSSIGGSSSTTLTGDVTGTGTGTIATTLATVATAGTSPKVTYNAKGLVTSGTTLSSSDIPNNAANTSGTAANITAASNSTLTTLSALSLPGSQVSGNISGNAGGLSSTLGILGGGTGVTSVTTSPAASAWSGWDANKNYSANNYLNGYTTTATAAGTTTLTVSSTGQQYFTGTTTQTVVLPVATTLVNGFQFLIVNNSTGVVTVNTSGSNTVQALAANTSLLVTCINTAGGTGTASWGWIYSPTQSTATQVSVGGTGKTSVTSTPTASSWAGWDANGNLNATNFIEGFTTTATAAGTTTLTATSTYIQYFTGSTTQTVKLPTTSIAAGGQYLIENKSTGVVTIQSSGANTITTLSANTGALFTALVATPTTAANWDFEFTPNVAGSSSGQVWTSTGTTSAPTWQSAGTSPTGSYAQATMPTTTTWSTTSASFADPSNTGLNTLSSVYASGITLTAAASNLPGITFTPSSSTAVYLIWAQAGIYNTSIGGGLGIRLYDGTTTISGQGGWTSSVASDGTTTTIGGVYAPGTASAVTVKLQILANAGTAFIGNNGSQATGTASIVWTVVRIF